MLRILGIPEVSSSGNSGNPASSMKMPLADAANLRGYQPGSTRKTLGIFSEATVQPANNNVASPTLDGSKADTSALATRYDLDSYRNYGREISEPNVDRPATIRITAVNAKKDAFGKQKHIVEAYSNFMLQSASEAEQEKYQVVETFTAYYAFFYGKRPPVYNYSGILLNDESQNWAGAFKFMYENYFRGTATAELGAQAYITYGNKVVSGFILNLNMQQDALTPNGIPFNFSMLVISYDQVGFGKYFDAFIKKQQANIAALKAKADADIKQLSKSPNALQNLLKNNVLNGALSPVSAAGADSPNKLNPLKNTATTETQYGEAAANKAVDPTTPIPGNSTDLSTIFAKK